MSKRVFVFVVIAAIAVIAWWRAQSKADGDDGSDSSDSAPATARAVVSPDIKERAELIASKFDTLVHGGSHWREDVQRDTSGRVYDLVSRDPVAGVEVVFRAKGAAGEASAVSNDDGEYSLTLGPGGYKVFAHGDGVYALGMRALLVPRSTQAPVRYDVPVQRTASVNGRVVDEQGRAVEGARVEFSSKIGRTLVDSRELSEILPSELEATTDRQGRFELDVVPGEVTLVARLEGGYGERKISLVGGQRYDIEIVVEDYSEVLGRVVSPSGDGVANANVSVVVYRSKERIATKSLVTDDDGEFSVLVRAGKAVAEARAAGYGQTLPRWVDLRPGGATESLELRLHDDAEIAGVVHDSQGTPISEAKVTVSATNSRIRVSARTQRDGGFRLTGLGPGQWQMSVFSAGYAQGRRSDLSAPTTDLEITLVRAKGIRGVVKDEGGVAIKDFTVRIDRYTSAIDGRTMPITGSGTRFTSDSGRFEVAVVEPGRYAIAVASPGRAAVEVAGIEVPVDGYGEAAVVIASGGSVGGVVVDADHGKPISNATVAPESGYEGRAVVTDDRGRFDIDAVAVGARSLAVSHPDYGTVLYAVSIASGSKSAVTVELSATASDEEMRLSGVGAIVDVQHGVLVITSLVQGAPARSAGLMAKDVIVAIDGVDVSGLTLQEAADRMRGMSGSYVELRIERRGEEMTVAVERASFVATRPGRGTVS